MLHKEIHIFKLNSNGKMGLTKTLILIFLISSFGSDLTGQSIPKSQNEIIQEIQDAKTPSEQCEIALKNSHSLFMYMKRNESLVVTKFGLQIAQKNSLNEYEVPLLIDLGRIYESFDQLDSAIYYADLARQKLTSKSEDFRGKVYSFLGRHYQYFGQLDSMLKYYTLAEDWNNENEPYRNWVLYEQWHKLYVETEDFKKAEELLDKAYFITQPKGNLMDHGMLLYRYRMLASRKGDMDMLAKFSKEYYDLVKDKPNKGVTAHGFDLGEHLTIKEKIKKYEELFVSNQKIAFDLGNKAYYPNLVTLLLQDGQVNKAKQYWTKIDTAEQSTQFKADYEDLGVEIFEKLGNHELALSHLKHKNILINLLQNKEKLKQIEEFNIKYETVEKEKQVAILEANDELKTLQLSKAEQSRLILMVGLLSTLFFTGGLAYLFIQNKKGKQELETKNILIEKALKDKDILLREIHHRVKNNLQVVSSLLNLQSNYISDEVALEAITEGKNRVSSMALIHQNLYHEENLTGINCKEYFEDLIENLFESYNIQKDQIQLEKNVSALNLDVETMVPLGLIVNELISNALKHAFTENQGLGKISFNLGERDGLLKLEIIDNGKGMNAQSFLNSKSFGNKLIQAFKQKLGAEIDIINDNGTNITLTIHKYKIAA